MARWILENGEEIVLRPSQVMGTYRIKKCLLDRDIRFNSYAPTQYIDLPSDFTILLTNGGILKAFYDKSHKVETLEDWLQVKQIKDLWRMEKKGGRYDFILKANPRAYFSQLAISNVDKAVRNIMEHLKEY